MLESDSRDLSDLAPIAARRPSRVARRRQTGLSPRQSLPEIQPFPRWARLDGAAGGAASAMFVAGAGIAHLDQLLRAGEDGGEPVFSRALRQRLALKAAATCARLARLREDEAALRDAEHLSGCADTSLAGRLHRLFRLFASRAVKFDAQTLSAAAEYVGAPSAFDAQGIAEALRQTVARANDPLAAAAGVSAAAVHDLAAVPAIDAEIFALWLADLALAQKLGWKAPVPLLATVIFHPALRRDQNGRRPRPDDRDWSNALAGAYALAAREAVHLAGALSRQTKKLFDAEPKLRAKGAARVIELLLADDCVTPARAAKRARLSDRAARRLFDRLIEVGAVRELSGRANFRLYGL
ncbi:DUF1403 family protein [Methylocystis sp.]|uniref:DUF1403 family protein n=1 Tax=Methylocystis sp. TaxID=1911079 RepID=UPI0025CE1147|nr:DUF1403 family protein [Methylocystis sp.]